MKHSFSKRTKLKRKSKVTVMMMRSGPMLKMQSLLSTPQLRRRRARSRSKCFLPTTEWPPELRARSRTVMGAWSKARSPKKKRKQCPQRKVHQASSHCRDDSVCSLSRVQTQEREPLQQKGNREWSKCKGSPWPLSLKSSLRWRSAQLHESQGRALLFNLLQKRSC